MTRNPLADGTLIDCGSIVLLKPLTDACREWIAEHLPDDRQEWCGAVVIEPRYVHDICLAAREAGLKFW